MRRVAIDVDQVVDADVAGGERKESGGVDVALVGDEHDAVAVADAEAAVDGGALDLGAGHAGLAHGVQRDAAVGGRLGGLDGEGRVSGSSSWVQCISSSPRSGVTGWSSLPRPTAMR